MFADVASGLAATAPGGFFNVIAAGADQYMILYQNLAGTAIEQKRYPAAEQVQKIAAQIRDDQGRDVFFSVADESGFAKFIAQQNGGFGTPEVFMGANALDNQAFTLRPSAPGVVFSVEDDGGYAAVHVRKGESVGDTASIAADLKRLGDTVNAAGTGAAIPTSRCPIIAHRGTTIGGIAPENSLDAYRLSARAGYRIVETDVLKTLDGHFVLMHDPAINRTCRNLDYTLIGAPVLVAETNLADLRERYVLSTANPRFRRKIPTLAEFLALCRDVGLYPMIELKNTEFSLEDVTAITEQAVGVLGPRGFALTSFNAPLLDHARTLYAGIELYYIYDHVNLYYINQVAAKAPAVLYEYYPAYAAEHIAYARTKDVTIAAWTVPNNQYDPLLKLGVTEFATDTLAPALHAQSVVYRNYSDSDFAAYTTTGQITNGVLTMTEGQTLSLIPRPGQPPYFGAYYLSFDFIGAAHLVASRLNDTLTNVEPEPVTFSFQPLIHNEAVAITLTAGAGGCSISDMSLAIAHF